MTIKFYKSLKSVALNLFLSTSLIITGCSSFQPKNLETPRIIENSEKVELRLQTEEEVRDILKKRDSTCEKKEKYAILINGFSPPYSKILNDIEKDAYYGDKLHEDNISRANNALKENGFKDENIFILSSLNQRPEYTSKNDLVITALPMKENLERIVSYIQRNATTNDALLVYLTGHGYNMGVGTNKHSYLPLFGEDLSSKEYWSMLKKVRSKKILSIADMCHAGGFADFQDFDFPVVSVSLSDLTHKSYCKHFAEPFWNSFMQGNNSFVDKNKDGKISIYEAYCHAIDYYNEHTQNSDIKGNNQFKFNIDSGLDFN